MYHLLSSLTQPLAWLWTPQFNQLSAVSFGGGGVYANLLTSFVGRDLWLIQKASSLINILTIHFWLFHLLFSLWCSQNLNFTFENSSAFPSTMFLLSRTLLQTDFSLDYFQIFESYLKHSKSAAPNCESPMWNVEIFFILILTRRLLYTERFSDKTSSCWSL